MDLTYAPPRYASKTSGGTRYLGALGVCNRLDDLLGPWAVSGPGLAVATVALRDRVWRKRMQRVLRTRRETFEELLGTIDLKVVGGTDLFVTIEDERAPRIAAAMAREHILVRDFTAEPRRLRFGVPGGQRALSRVADALRPFAPDAEG